MNINLDEGYFFGIGVFETINVVNGVPVLLEFHIERLNKALNTLSIDKYIMESDILNYIHLNNLVNTVLKVAVSKDNVIFTTRANTYTEDMYTEGFRLGFSEVMRNETSIMTYVKSLSQADNIIEKRKAKIDGIDEVIFFNSKGEITEGAVSNIFFVKGFQIYTPAVSCGLLDGTVRRYIIENFDVIEKSIRIEELEEFDEIFITNSLMGVMPVSELEGNILVRHEMTNKVRRYYEENCLN